MCCEGWFYKTILSLTALASLASVNKDLDSLGNEAWYFLVPWPSPALEGLTVLPVIHSQSPGVSLRVH